MVSIFMERHLNENGKIILANNYIRNLNNFFILCHRNSSVQVNDLNICKNAFGQFADDLQTQNSNNNFLNDSNSDKFIKKVNCPDDVISILIDIKIKNVNKLIIGNLNINSFARKFDQFKTKIQNKRYYCHYRNKT